MNLLESHSPHPLPILLGGFVRSCPVSTYLAHAHDSPFEVVLVAVVGEHSASDYRVDSKEGLDRDSGFVGPVVGFEGMVGSGIDSWVEDMGCKGVGMERGKD
jgi:hypothetical protein